MHGFEKNRLRLNYVGIILILYFDEDQMSYDYSWILENIGSVNLYTFDFFCILGLTTVQSL